MKRQELIHDWHDRKITAGLDEADQNNKPQNKAIASYLRRKLAEGIYTLDNFEQLDFDAVSSLYSCILDAIALILPLAKLK
jgi:hypothetical protein